MVPLTNHHRQRGGGAHSILHSIPDFRVKDIEAQRDDTACPAPTAKGQSQNYPSLAGPKAQPLPGGTLSARSHVPPLELPLALYHAFLLHLTSPFNYYFTCT